MRDVIRRARLLDERYNIFNALADDAGEVGTGRLAGYAVSVKDNICTKGVQTTAGSRILEGYVPPFDATVVSKCRDEGAFILGKTTQDEFGFGTFNVNTAYGIPRNPHDPERSCGGSSGGAACLTAVADFPHAAISESTGGSISCPASFCGVVGVTPTYGRTSRWGLVDYANSLDKIGVMGKTVEEAALLLSVISGPDEYDSTVLRVPPEDFTESLGGSVEGMRIGVPEEYLLEGVEEMVAERVRSAIDGLQSLGAVVSDVSLPHTGVSLASYYIIAMAEASTNLAKFCGLRYGLHMPLEGNFDEYFSRVRARGFSEEAKRRVILGTFTRMAGYRDAYYLKALRVRTRVIKDFKRAFEEVDVLAAPTMPVVAPRFDEIEEMEPIQHYMMDVLTVAPNLAGIPMISVPCGEVGGMPVGLHLMADHLQEGKMIRAAHAYEVGR
ncbi:MAG: Asp-tRNA(Asn)/Glu-tRNA(Gln) amidotransferase subunit GatA [Candidatus Bathyarchaeota archaeon]|nr:MAG: Asp-tRNA(Asn)/Glu-tRNA(Gln) amidotransferase subunit GatA [Candidatus Bathyarchaeota archaeon]